MHMFASVHLSQCVSVSMIARALLSFFLRTSRAKRTWEASDWTHTPPLLMWLRGGERAEQSVCQHSVGNCLHRMALAFTQMAAEECWGDPKEGHRKGR